MYYISVCILLVGMGLAPFNGYTQKEPSPSRVLAEAEKKRIPWDQMSLYASLSDSTGAKPAQSYFHIFIQEEKVLVVGLQPASQMGNLLLLVNQEMWMQIHGTSQPIRITPLQRLGGSVSFVDLARLSWTRDFTVDSMEKISPGSLFKQGAYLLHLLAKNRTVSYQKINLWVDKKSNRPLMATIFLGTDKPYKTIRFLQYQVQSGREINTEIELEDHFSNNQKTVVYFSHPQPEKKIPAEYFMPEKLAALSKSMGKMP